MKLIIFDMDGVIFEHINFWLELHKAYGTYEEGAELTERYVKTDYQKLVDEVVGRLWKGKPAKPYFDLIKKIKYLPDVKETAKELKKEGYKIAIISAGPKELAEMAKEELGLDYIYTNELLIKNNKIVGSRDIKHWPIRFGNKAEALRELCRKHNIDLKDVIVVGHDEADVKMAKSAGFAIALNPRSDELVKYSNKVVRGSIKNILKAIEEFEKTNSTRRMP